MLNESKKTHEKLLAQRFIRFIQGCDTPFIVTYKVYHILPERTIRIITKKVHLEVHLNFNIGCDNFEAENNTEDALKL